MAAGGLAALAVGVAAISWASVLARLAGVDGVTAAWWRLLVGVLVTLAYAVAAGRGLILRGRLLAYSAGAGAALAAHFMLWLESLRYTSVAASTGIVVSYPVFTLALEAVAGHKPAPKRAVGVALALAGVVLLAQPWQQQGSAQGDPLLGGLLALGGAAAGAAYFYLGRLARTGGAENTGYTLNAYASALAATSLSAALLGVNPLAAPAGSIPYLVLLGLVPMLAGHSMLNYALRYYTATTVSSATLLEPFGATLLALLVLGEQPPPQTLPGLAMTTTGSYLVLASEQQPQNPARKAGR